MQAIVSGGAQAAGSRTSVETLAEDLNALILFIHKQSCQQFFALADGLELSLTQIKVLHRLDDHGSEVSVKELAELMGLSFPAASRTVEALLGRGFLDRREDEVDRRMKRVWVTEQGREAVVRMNSARLAGLEQFVQTLSDDEREATAHAMAALLAREDIAATRTTTPTQD